MKKWSWPQFQGDHVWRSGRRALASQQYRTFLVGIPCRWWSTGIVYDVYISYITLPYHRGQNLNLGLYIYIYSTTDYHTYDIYHIFMYTHFLGSLIDYPSWNPMIHEGGIERWLALGGVMTVMDLPCSQERVRNEAKIKEFQTGKGVVSL